MIALVVVLAIVGAIVAVVVVVAAPQPSSPPPPKSWSKDGKDGTSTDGKDWSPKPSPPPASGSALSPPPAAISVTVPTQTATLKILCLHGGGGSSASIQAGTAALRSALPSSVSWVFAQSPYAGGLWVPDPPGGKSQPTTNRDVADESVTYLDNLLATQGPFDGLLGYSQGSMMTTYYLARKAPGTFRFGLMFCGNATSTKCSDTAFMLLNWGPIAYLLVVWPVMAVLARNPKGVYYVVLTGGIFVCAGTVTRLIPVVFSFERSAAALPLLHLGQFFNGVGGPAFATTPSAFAAAWFPPRERTPRRGCARSRSPAWRRRSAWAAGAASTPTGARACGFWDVFHV